MKSTNNQFFGKERELPAELPEGSTYISTDTKKVYIYGSDRKPHPQDNGGGGGVPTSPEGYTVTGSVATNDLYIILGDASDYTFEINVVDNYASTKLPFYINNADLTVIGRVIADRLTIGNDSVVFNGARLALDIPIKLRDYTVATLPGGAEIGETCIVTDATAPTYLGALTGGGVVVCPVFFNGTIWVSH